MIPEAVGSPLPWGIPRRSRGCGSPKSSPAVAGVPSGWVTEPHAAPSDPDPPKPRSATTATPASGESGTKCWRSRRHVLPFRRRHEGWVPAAEVSAQVVVEHARSDLEPRPDQVVSTGRSYLTYVWMVGPPPGAASAVGPAAQHLDPGPGFGPDPGRQRVKAHGEPPLQGSSASIVISPWSARSSAILLAESIPAMASASISPGRWRAKTRSWLRMRPRVAGPQPRASPNW